MSHLYYSVRCVAEHRARQIPKSISTQLLLSARLTITAPSCLCFPATAAPCRLTQTPCPTPNQALVSVSVIGTQDSMSDEQLQAAVLAEMGTWFGADQVATWSHLKTYRSVLVCLRACTV
jgi:hypothetical protein